MKPAFHHKHRVEFVETDAAGIVHFSRFPIWVDEAETAFWRENGVNIPVKNEGKLKGFPKIKLDISYRVSARVGDLVEITMSPTYAGRTSVVWFFKITRGEHLLADGSMTVVYATIDLISGKIVREPVPSLWAKFLKEREE